MIIKSCHLAELFICIKGKKIICFGAGKYMEDMSVEFPDMNFTNHIKLFWDNAVIKWGTKKVINDKIFPICKPGEFMGIDSDDCVVLITTNHYMEILYQLESMESCRMIECYVADFMKCQYYDNRRFIQRKDQSIRCFKHNTMQIPKKIHYCWFGKKEVPDRYKYYMETWYKNCPDYEFVKWDESNYNISSNLYTLQAYESGKWGFVPDYIRLDILYNYGGIYLDMDVELKKNFDELLYYEGFAGFESIDEVNCGQGIGARKGLPIIKEMMDFYNKILFRNEDGSLNMKPSPKYQTEILIRHGLKLNDSIQYVAGMIIFPRSYFCPKSVKNGLTIITPETYSIHHFAASWLDTKLFQKEYREILVVDEDGKVSIINEQ